MISILALTLLSGFILEMFLLASRVNQKAQDTDAGAGLAARVSEVFKQQAGPFDLKTDPLLAGAAVNEKDHEINLSLYYDGQWNVLQTPSAGEIPPDAQFNMEVRVAREPGGTPSNLSSYAYAADDLSLGDGAVEGALYGLWVQAYRLDPETGRTDLVRLEAGHYFVSVE
jgi:hypothetical protein